VTGMEGRLKRMRFFHWTEGVQVMGKKIIACAVFLLVFLGGSFSVFAMPQPDYTFLGTVSVNGIPLTQADTGYTVSLEVDGVELVRYRMGDNPGAGDSYVLIVPMDDDPAVTTKAQIGDTAYVYINGVEVDESPFLLVDTDEIYPENFIQDINAMVYTISGYVRDSGGTGIEGVEMGGLPGDSLTSSDGQYTGLLPPGWTGTVTPTKSGYTFSPASMSYSNVLSHYTDQDYTATLITYTISGAVSTFVGTGIADVMMSGLPGNPGTSPDGSYVGTVPHGWTGVVSPMKSGYSFSPGFMSYIDVTSDHTGQNYTGSLEGNRPPVALAGPDQIVDEGVEVTLDGSNSYDGDDGIYAYQWTQLDGQPVTLSDTTASSPTFFSPSVDLDGEALRFELRVIDFDGQESSDICIVNVTSQNLPPVADAGPDQEVRGGDRVLLYGDNSYDPDGTISSYLWTQLTGAHVTLSDETVPQPTFTAGDAPEGESLIFELFVTDDGGLQASDTCIVTVLGQNRPPVADAGPNQVVDEGVLVLLDGSDSCDPDGDDITFLWKQLEGTGVHLSDVTEMQPTFPAPNVAPNGESLIFELMVTDEWGLSSRDRCIVSVVTPQNAPPVADAGADRKVEEGTRVELNGGGSYDPDGTIAWCQWSQISGPPVTLEDATEMNGSFTAPEVGPEGEVLVFQFTVCDGVLHDCDEITIEVTDKEEGGGNGGPTCGIIAAATGSPLMEKLDILRQLRDRYLRSHIIGRAFVRMYYEYGPYFARYIEDHEVIRRLVRVGLYPIVGVSYVLIKITLFQKLIMMVPFCVLLAVITLLRNKKGKLPSQYPLCP